ncbi:unnamed protein product [Orchesella dallaii]|uniref:Uncharacterized protein n=1 Tax=Orchesella dallaii TaxID=48710 RepID=A0ABP1R8W8_9HEXA
MHVLDNTHKLTCYGQNTEYQDASLWPGITGRGISLMYSEAPTEWSELYPLLNSNGFFTIGKLCVRGTFILYESPMYEVKTPNAFKIISGDGKCTVISEATQSIQVVGSVGRIKQPSITFFEKPNFGSEAHPTIVNVACRFFRKMEDTLSAITIGSVPWTLQLRNGTRICLKPHFDPQEKYPICLIRDFRQLLGTPEPEEDDDEPEVEFVRASQGCRPGILEEVVYRLQDCHYWGEMDHTGRTKDLITRSDDVEGRTLSVEGLCGGNDEKSKSLFALYKAAITNDFEYPMFIGMHKLGKNAWKLDILDYTFSIVQDIVTEDLIPMGFLNKVREFFISKLANVWEKNTEEANFTLSEREYTSLIRLTKYCQRKPDWINEFRRAWGEIQVPEDLTSEIAEGFKHDPSRNIIVEFVWLAGHMVANLCHLDYAYRIPFWSLFLRAFRELYWNPVVPEWKIPQEATELIFGGIDHLMEYNKFAMFTTMVQKSIGLLEPLDFPEALLKKPKTE